MQSEQKSHQNQNNCIFYFIWSGFLPNLQVYQLYGDYSIQNYVKLTVLFDWWCHKKVIIIVFLRLTRSSWDQNEWIKNKLFSLFLGSILKQLCVEEISCILNYSKLQFYMMITTLFWMFSLLQTVSFDVLSWKICFLGLLLTYFFLKLEKKYS